MFGVDTGGSDVSAHREATSTLKLVLQKKRKLWMQIMDAKNLCSELFFTLFLLKNSEVGTVKIMQKYLHGYAWICTRVNSSVCTGGYLL